jgi:phospholipid/cholesterol/gamma-HCH transport system substrate-binding protein
MALQDLTPQLRTRLNRMERAVGGFVLVATVLLLVGFGYFLHNTAKRKGWFTPKYTYQTSLNNAAGLKEGDPVRLMGFPAGKITRIEPNDPSDYYGVTVSFAVLKPHYGYIWDDSMVKVSSDLLGNRFLEITKGVSGVPTIAEGTNRLAVAMLRWQEMRDTRTAVLASVREAHPDLDKTDPATFAWHVMDGLKKKTESDQKKYFTNLTAVYWIEPAETAALNERLERLATQVEQALPNILDLTNKIGAVLGNTANLTSNLNVVAENVQPAVANFAALAAQLRGPGALGEWALGTNGQKNLDATLANANQTIANTDTNLALLFENLAQSLDNLAGITSNLNAQVQANTNMLGSISQAVVNADDLVQGLKRHWLLRSAFKKKDAKAVAPTTSPKAGGR